LKILLGSAHIPSDSQTITPDVVLQTSIAINNEAKALLLRIWRVIPDVLAVEGIDAEDIAEYLGLEFHSRKQAKENVFLMQSEVVNDQEQFVGFNVYLVLDEPELLGQVPRERV
jgi:hypothetical protein